MEIVAGEDRRKSYLFGLTGIMKDGTKRRLSDPVETLERFLLQYLPPERVGNYREYEPPRSPAEADAQIAHFRKLQRQANMLVCVLAVVAIVMAVMLGMKVVAGWGRLAAPLPLRFQAILILATTLTFLSPLAITLILWLAGRRRFVQGIRDAENATFDTPQNSESLAPSAPNTPVSRV